MGFLTVLKKIRQKEKEMRILLLYPFKTNLNIRIQFLTRKWIYHLVHRSGQQLKLIKELKK